MLQITISKRVALIIVLALILVIPGVAVATHVFLDVGDGDTHAEGIEWVADAGVSVGCGDGTNYCPDDDVSRAQMGTFMYRLSGNDPATDPSVNAATLEGSGPLSYTTQIDGLACVDAVGTCPNPPDAVITSIIDFPLSVPADGVVALDYHTAFNSPGTPTNAIQSWLTLDDTSCGSWFFYPVNAIQGTFSNITTTTDVVFGSLSARTVLEMDAGDYTVSLCLLGVGDPITILDGSINSVWSASG